MATRHEALSDEQREAQTALNRSWEGARGALADPEFRATLEASIARVNAADSTLTMSRDEFLADTADAG